MITLAELERAVVEKKHLGREEAHRKITYEYSEYADDDPEFGFKLNSALNKVHGQIAQAEIRSSAPTAVAAQSEAAPVETEEPDIRGYANQIFPNKAQLVDEDQRQLVDDTMDHFNLDLSWVNTVSTIVDSVIAERTPVPTEREWEPEFQDDNRKRAYTVGTDAFGPVVVNEDLINIDTGEKIATPEVIATVQRFKQEEKKQDYKKLVEDAQRGAEELENTYPVGSWEGTPYLEFARLCQGTGKDQNYIPLEYFINGLMTVVGAICGNRITPEFNQKMEARFITLLLSTKGGIGKNETMKWSKECFNQIPLLHTGGIVHPFKNIGCYVGDFGSARGMLEKFMQYPRILQEYGELSTAVEKFSIASSGQAFRDQILNLADDQTPNWSTIKGMKVSADAPKAISNSVLSATTNDRFEEMMMQASWETLIQRMNIIPTKEERTKFKLVAPDLSKMADTLLPRITRLEAYRLIWNLSPEAEQLGEKWFETLQSNASAGGENVGRIQVYLFRILSHLALWHAPLPATDQEGDTTRFTANGWYIPEGTPPDRIWRYQVPPELMQKAIRVAEHQIVARRENMPVRGTTISGAVENIIKKWAFKNRSMRWVEMKDRAHLYRFGYKLCHDGLMNLVMSGIVAIKKNPEDENDQRDWIVVWVGSPGRCKKWAETRGGKREGAGRKAK